MVVCTCASLLRLAVELRDLSQAKKNKPLLLQAEQIQTMATPFTRNDNRMFLLC